jgi:hypothetical protein
MNFYEAFCDEIEKAAEEAKPRGFFRGTVLPMVAGGALALGGGSAAKNVADIFPGPAAKVKSAISSVEKGVRGAASSIGEKLTSWGGKK